ncbi:MAG: hypothetical protein IKN73_03680 [Alphaproteobacteria bacterium]|nr:hypothetical protein [Alphaproteobacteria bacterium]
MILNFTTESKTKALFKDNYAENTTKDLKCKDCFFVGQFTCNNNYLSERLLCGKHLKEISDVKENASCDAARSVDYWFNKFDLFARIKQKIAEKSGFKFNNR